MVDKTLADLDFLRRVEEDFVPEDMTEENIQQWLYHGETKEHLVKWGMKDSKQRYKLVKGKTISEGTKRLAMELSEVGKLYNQIVSSRTTEELEGLREDILEARVHSDSLFNEFESKTEELFLKEKKIKEKKIKVRREIWRDKKIRLVARKLGRLKGWKIISKLQRTD